MERENKRRAEASMNNDDIDYVIYWINKFFEVNK